MSRFIKLFEAFSGIGSQITAMKNILNNKELLKTIGINPNKFELKNVGISEFFIDAIISYDKLNFGSQEDFPKYKSLTKKVMLKYLFKFTLSKDSKKPCSKAEIKKLSFEKVRQIYIALKRTKNFGSIADIQGKDLPKIDIFTYSFPCQNLSSIGRGEGIKEGTSSGLLLEVKRLLIELKLLGRLPKFLLCENVKNILSKKHIDGWNEFAEFLESLGYKNSIMVLNAKDFGISQSRERFFCISQLNGTEEIEVEKKDTCPSIHDFLDLNNDELIDEYKEVMPNLTPSRITWIEKSKKLNDREYCQTITTKQDRWPNAGILFCDSSGKLINNEEENIHINGDKAPYRFLTPREQLLLMGFENSTYDKLKEIGMSKTNIQMMAGNSIVVQKLEAIFVAILKKIKRKELWII
jgi:DNA (cytosine-5)-methyltransferase 1